MLGTGLIGAGCSTPQPPPNFGAIPDHALQKPVASVVLSNRFDRQWLVPSTNLFTLGPGDKLDLELIGDTNSLSQTVVCPDGKIYFNILEGLDVWGMTLSQTKALLEQKFAEQIRNGPKVSVTLREVQSKRVWVLGRVLAPGVYPITHPTTLLEALALAGGTATYVSQHDVPLSTAVEELADLKRSFIVRHGRLLPVDFERLMDQGDLSQNIYVQPDDFIYLPPATEAQVYVIGAVGQPRAVTYTHNLTLAGAIAGAYGTVKDAYLSHVAIVRGSLSDPQFSIVDYHDIVHGRAQDVQLERNDIVYVPYSPYRYIVKYAETVMNTFAAAVAINAGSQLVVRNPTTGGVFIPVGSRITINPPLPPPAP